MARVTTPVGMKPMTAMKAYCRQESSVLAGVGAGEEFKGSPVLVGLAPSRAIGKALS
jgi:hypothetical protein